MNAIEFEGRGWKFGGFILLVLVPLNVLCFGLVLVSDSLAPAVPAAIVTIPMVFVIAYMLLPRKIVISDYGIELFVLGERHFHAPWQEIVLVTNVSVFWKPWEQYLIIRSHNNMVRLIVGFHMGFSELVQVFRTLAQHQGLYPQMTVVDNLGWR